MGKERRTAKRFDYDHAGLILFKNGKHTMILRSISQKGIFIECEQAFEVDDVVQIGWKDDRIGYIKGAFTITLKKQSTDEKRGCFYHARYLHMDDASKKNTITLLNLLNQPKHTSEDADLQQLQRVFQMDGKVFQAFLRGDKLPSHVVSLLKEIGEEEMQVHLNANSELEQSFQKLQMYFIQSSLLVHFLESVEQIDSDDLSYCFDYGLYLSHEIAALEQTSGFAEPVHAPSNEEQELEEELRKILNKPIVVLSNKVYECLLSLRDYCEEKLWDPKLVVNQNTDKGLLDGKSKEIVSVFELKYEISYDEHSYSEAVLDRIYEKSAESKVDALEVPEDIDFGKPRKSKVSLYIVGILAFFLLVQGFSLMRGVKNDKSKFEDDLQYPITIEKVFIKGANLLVYLNHTQWVAASKNDVNMIRVKTLKYLDQQRRYQSVFVFSDDETAEFMLTRKRAVQ